MPSAMLLNMSSSETLEEVFIIDSLSFLLRSSITCFISVWETAYIESPELGTSSRPSTLTAMEGPASLTVLPLSSIMARTLPVTVPEMRLSPVRRVPF